MPLPHIPGQTPSTSFEEMPTMNGETAGEYGELPSILERLESGVHTDMPYTAKSVVVANGIGLVVSSNWGVIQDAGKYANQRN
ncbi:MAG: hypothetical protein LBT05_08445 [Planctomycetaceae bacterium]|nr:hypothetical protein [Planctomycetaceae bacterium]